MLELPFLSFSYKLIPTRFARTAGRSYLPFFLLKYRSAPVGEPHSLADFSSTPEARVTTFSFSLAGGAVFLLAHLLLKYRSAPV